MRPPADDILFLTERPYLPPGTLRQALVRTGREQGLAEARILEVLRELGVAGVLEKAGGLDVERDWAELLSLGEQQALSFARLALAAPRYAILDRPQTVLGAEAVAKALDFLAGQSITVVTFASDPALAARHDARIALAADGSWSFEPLRRRARPHERRRRPARSSAPLGATVGCAGVNFSVYSKNATLLELLLFDRERASPAQPSRVIHRSHRRPAPHLPLLARLRAAGSGRGSSTAIGSYGPVRPGARTALRSRKAAARPLRPRGRRAARIRAASAACRPGDNAAAAHEERRGRPARLRLGGRPAAAAPYARDRDLRAARARLHARTPARASPAAGGHLRRPDREDPLPAGSRRHRRRAAAGLPVRRAGLPPGLCQLLGLQPASPSSRRTAAYSSRQDPLGARSTSSATWSRPSTARASR